MATAVIPTTTAPPAPLPADTLMAIASGIASASELWAAHVVHDPHDRHPVRLLATEAYEVWVIGWTQGQGVDMHDHGGSAGVLVVTEGTLHERRPDGVDTALSAGDAAELPTDVVHEVSNVDATPATSIHVYSPPLLAMGYYDSDGDRVLQLQHVAAEPVALGPGASARALHPAGRHA